MGSPSSRLNTPEHLRVWLESGLEYVFHPGAAAQKAQAAAAPETAPVRPKAPPRPAPVEPAKPSLQASPPKNLERPVPPPRQIPVEGEGEGLAKSSPGNFPEPWATFLGKVSETHLMVWTYMELGIDLGGRPDPRRRALMGDLIKHLNLPPGPVAFWPVAEFRDGALQPERAMFWKGWRLWRTPHVVCFGKDALSVVLPDADPELTTHMLDNVMVHVLPSVEELLSMLPHERQLAVEGLSSLR